MCTTDLHQAISQHFSIYKAPGEDYQRLMSPSSRNPRKVAHNKQPKVSAVLVLLYLKNEAWHICLTKRHVYPGKHSGQVSLPGGKVDNADTDLLATALRETKEEVGISCSRESVVGQLTPLHIPISNFIVTPYIAVIPSVLEFTPDSYEVDYLIEMPLSTLADASKRKETVIESENHTITTPYYSIHDEIIWGATAMILSEFGEVIRRIRKDVQG